MGNLGNSGCLLWVLQGTVAVCCGYCREEWVCAVDTVGNSVVCCGYCREQWLCAVGTVGNSACVLWLL